MDLARSLRRILRLRCVRLLIGLLMLFLSGIVLWGNHLQDSLNISDSNTDVIRTSVRSNAIAPYNKKVLENRTKNNTEWFQDSLIWGKRNQNQVYLSIGIPCILRPNHEQYIVKTLNSLIRHSSPTQKQEMVIVLFLGDSEESARKEIGEFLYNKYREYVDSGFMLMIKAPGNFYPEFKDLKLTYHDPMTKVKWRSKQNFDFAFNMLYSQSLSRFYLQLEDDVITVANYFQIIKDFIAENDSKDKSWVCLEFCSLGFIAKLYHTKDLEKLAQMLMLFYNEHPNDVTYLRFNELMFQKKRIIRTPTIFDHKGRYSSMFLKVNTLNDKLFKGDPNDVDNDPDIKVRASGPANHNPPAKLSTTLKLYETYTPEKFYTGEENIFWSGQPKQGDSFTIVFNNPQRLSNISVETGHSSFPDDILQNGVLQLASSGSIMPKPFCSNTVHWEEFRQGRVTIANIPRDPAIACINILVRQVQSNWLMISKLSMHFHPS